jgi:hypothetical protein
MKDN